VVHAGAARGLDEADGLDKRDLVGVDDGGVGREGDVDLVGVRGIGVFVAVDPLVDLGLELAERGASRDLGRWDALALQLDGDRELEHDAGAAEHGASAGHGILEQAQLVDGERRQLRRRHSQLRERRRRRGPVARRDGLVEHLLLGADDGPRWRRQ
jgi:hypothetical protein